MGFGDLFIAATLGALLASDRRLQLRGAALAAVICPAFDLLFFCVDQTPATVPIALTLAALELTRRLPTQIVNGQRDEAGHECRSTALIATPKINASSLEPIHVDPARSLQPTSTVERLSTCSNRLSISRAHVIEAFVDRSKRSSIRFPNSSSRSSVQFSLIMVSMLPAYRANATFCRRT